MATLEEGKLLRGHAGFDEPQFTGPTEHCIFTKSNQMMVSRGSVVFYAP